MITHACQDSEVIQRQIATVVGPVKTMLDIGCGIRPAQVWMDCPKIGYVGIDAYPKYIEAVARVPTAMGMTFEHWVLLQDVPLEFEDGEFEVVVLSDVLEHLDKPVGDYTLREAWRVTKRGLVVCSPVGWQPQEVDLWGMGGEHWQTHRSAWTPEDDFEDAQFVWTTKHHSGPWFAAWIPKESK